jgi:DNA polymerase
MPWAERQLAMLRELGLRTALPTAAAAAAAGTERGTAQQDPGREAPEPGPPARSMDIAPDAAPGLAPGAGGPGQAVGRVPTAPAIAGAAGADAIASLGWEALREAVAACEACALHQTRRQTVFGVGGTQARWMVVGEAPGEQEDARGEPFVGAAGQLLDRMLAALGLTRRSVATEGEPAPPPEQQVYIANTLKCRPPRNRNPQPEELARCEPFLVRQIELLQPRVILAMGRFAVQALLRSDEAIGRLRSRVHRYHGVPLIVTYHPAYLLRNPADKARAWEDLCLAAHTLQAAPDAAV